MIQRYSYNTDKDKFISPHFQVWEFRSFDDEQQILTTDEILIDTKLVEYLENLFNTLNCSIIKITSGYRDETFDERIGGFKGFHSKGQAADFMCYDQNNNQIDPKNICLKCEDLNINGVGYGSNYNHIDTRDYKSYFDETNGNTNIDSWYKYFNIKEDYNIGDTVEINGVYVSSIDDNKLNPLITIGTITHIIDAKNPYLLNNGDIGWVNKDCIVRKINQNIKVGDKVKIRENIQYNGQKFIQYYDEYDVLEINGDRVVIGIGNIVTCATNINNIFK